MLKTKSLDLSDNIKSTNHNQKGMTLLEILFTLILFLTSTLAIISLIITAIDKPKQAGIESVFNSYRTYADILLLETEGNISKGDLSEYIREYNSRLDANFKFGNNVQDTTFAKSVVENPYGNPYIIDIVTDSTSNKASIVITTQGQEVGQDFKLGVYYLDGEVYTATFGFGRRDRVIRVTSEEAIALGLIVDDDTDGNSDIISITP